MIIQSVIAVNDMINHQYRNTVYKTLDDPATHKKSIEVVQYLYNRKGKTEPTHHVTQVDQRA